MGRALLALGSNLDSRPAWLDLAAETIAGQGGEIVAAGPRWNTAALDILPQPDYLNQLLLVAGPFRGRGWLELAQAAEARAGRRRLVAKGPRTLDVDVILIEGERWATPQLTVPHPGLLTRPYLLRGAATLVPGWVGEEEGVPMAELARRQLRGSWASGLDLPRLGVRGAGDPPAPGLP